MIGLTMSQVAKESNVNITTIRYYEKRGLLSKPPRTQAGYRMYSNETIHDIHFIKKAQDLGFTLEEIKNLLSLYKDEGFYSTEEMQHFAIEKYKEIDAKIQQLNMLKDLLEIVTNRPTSEFPISKSRCPILKKIIDEGENSHV